MKLTIILLLFSFTCTGQIAIPFTIDSLGERKGRHIEVFDKVNGKMVFVDWYHWLGAGKPNINVNDSAVFYPYGKGRIRHSYINVVRKKFVTVN